jgi:NADH:ubiquinone oxidoreductase subunit E
VIISTTGEPVLTNIKKQLDDILSRYSKDRENLIPLLQEVQERFGYLPEEAMELVADFLKLSNSTIYAVSTFYAQFKLTPTGKRLVKICRGTACHVRGGAQVLREVEKQLDIKPGETTKDLEYTLEMIACFGSCALAPVMVIDNTVYGRITTTKVGPTLADNKK